MTFGRGPLLLQKYKILPKRRKKPRHIDFDSMYCLFRRKVHIGHYSPSVFNKNIQNYRIQKMTTHQESKIGGVESPDRVFNSSRFTVQL